MRLIRDKGIFLFNWKSGTSSGGLRGFEDPNWSLPLLISFPPKKKGQWRGKKEGERWKKLRKSVNEFTLDFPETGEMPGITNMNKYSLAAGLLQRLEDFRPKNRKAEKESQVSVNFIPQSDCRCHSAPWIMHEGGICSCGRRGKGAFLLLRRCRAVVKIL